LVHRLGGGELANLRLKASERALAPPGISVFLGGTAQEAADQMRGVFRDKRKYQRLHRLAATVGSATIEVIRQAGFDVIPDPTSRFVNHGRIIHPRGEAGFDDASLAKLARVLHDTTGC